MAMAGAPLVTIAITMECDSDLEIGIRHIARLEIIDT
jgi:hypothetical protein